MDKNKSISAFFCSKCGDVNGDLKITAADAQAAFEIFLWKIQNPTACQIENADVNCDGTKANPSVTASDAQAIFEKFIGKSELPCNCSGTSRKNLLSSQSNKNSVFSFIINERRTQTEGEVYVSVIIEDIKTINAFGFDLVFPPETLEFVTLEKTESIETFVYIDSNEIASGILRVGGYKKKIADIPSPNVLFTLVFRTIKEVKQSPSFFILNTFDDIKRSSIKKEASIRRNMEFF